MKAHKAHISLRCKWTGRIWTELFRNYQFKFTEIREDFKWKPSSLTQSPSAAKRFTDIYLWMPSVSLPLVPISRLQTKGKVRPKTSREGPEGEQRYSSILYPRRQMGVGGQRHAPSDITRGNRPGTQCTACRVGSRGRSWWVRKTSPTPRFEPSPYRVAIPTTQHRPPPHGHKCFPVINY
jgi:hypothetical protein